MPEPMQRPQKKRKSLIRSVRDFLSGNTLPRPPAAAPQSQIERDRQAAAQRGADRRRAAGGTN